MAAFTDYMEQTATYWAPGVPDGYGKLDFTAVTPVTITCRWQNVAQLFRDNNGREQISNAIVYTDQLVAVRGYLGLGDIAETGETDPRNIDGAIEIRQIGDSPDIDNNEVLYKAWL